MPGFTRWYGRKLNLSKAARSNLEKMQGHELVSYLNKQLSKTKGYVGEYVGLFVIHTRLKAESSSSVYSTGRDPTTPPPPTRSKSQLLEQFKQIEREAVAHDAAAPKSGLAMRNVRNPSSSPCPLSSSPTCAHSNPILAGCARPT